MKAFFFLFTILFISTSFSGAPCRYRKDVVPYEFLVKYNGTYCAGAKPPAEMIEEINREKILAGLKEISGASAIHALNNLLTEPHELSQTTRKYCLKFFVQEGITSVYISDKPLRKFALSKM